MGIYGRYQETLERLRIGRHVLREKADRGAWLATLVWLRRDVLGPCALLLLALLAVDWALATSVLPWLWRQSWYVAWSNAWPYPGPDVVDLVLVVILEVIGAVLAILFGVSQLALQASIDRYTPRVTRFFLGEGTANLILGLMVRTLILALWALVLHRVVPFTPYVTSLAVVLLATASVALLVTYRGHAILGVMPRETADLIGHEAGKAVSRVASRPGGFGRSVDTHLRERVADAVDLLAEVGQTILRSGARDSEAEFAIPALGGILREYIAVKRHIEPMRLWFPRRRVRIPSDRPWDVHLLGRGYREFALGTPVKEEIDDGWLERLVLGRAERLAADGVEAGSSECAMAAAVVLPELLEHAFRQQEEGIFSLCAQTTARLCDLAHRHGYAGVVDTAVRGLVKAAYAAIDAPTAYALEAASSIDWRHPEPALRNAPGRIVRDTIAQMHTRLLAEWDAYGRQVTPRHVVRADLEAECENALSAFQREAYRSIWAAVGDVALGVAAEETAVLPPMLAHAMLLLYRRPTVRGKAHLADGLLPDLLSLVAWLDSAEAFPAEAEQEVFEEVKEASFAAAAQQDSDALVSLLPLYLSFGARACQHGDRLVGFDRFMTAVAAIGGYVTGVAELRQRPDLYRAVEGAVFRMVDIEQMLVWYRDFLKLGGPYHLSRIWPTAAEYHARFVDLSSEIRGLPEVTVSRPPSQQLWTEHDHPSEFIRRFGDLDHHDSFMEEFVRRVTRRWLGAQLVSVLSARMQARLGDSAQEARED